MSEHAHGSERGTFICRIDGRAGYLRLWDDRLELIRSGRRGPQVTGPEVIPLHLITAVSMGKPGRLLTAVQLVAAGGYLELKMPSIDAPRIAELISLLASQAPAPADIPSGFTPEPMVAVPAAVSHIVPAQAYEPVAYEPVAFEAAESVMADFVMPDFSMKVEMPEWTPLAEDGATPVAAPHDLAEIVSQREYLVAEVEMPAIPKVEMPHWTPLPETDRPDSEMPEMVLSQIVLDELNATPEPAWSASPEPVTEIEPLPEGSVLAAAAALAELESMLNEVPLAAVGDVDAVYDDDDMVAEAREIFALGAVADDGSDEASVPVQPSEAVLTLAAAALLGGARSAVEPEPEIVPEPAPRPERPADLPADLERRLNGLEVLRNSGIMTDADFLAAEAELLASVWAETNSA